jgi:hypothetical protein
MGHLAASAIPDAPYPSSIAVRQLREELQLLQEPGSYVGEVIKVRALRGAGLAAAAAFRERQRGTNRHAGVWMKWPQLTTASNLSDMQARGERAAAPPLVARSPADAAMQTPPPPHPTHQVMGKSKVLVKVHPEGKYVVDLDKSIDAGDLTAGGCLGACLGWSVGWRLVESGWLLRAAGKN